MNKSFLNYRIAMLALGGSMLLLAAVFALGIIWERQQKSTLAKQVSKLESTLETAQRKHRFVSERFAQAHMPANLMRLAGDQFVVPDQAQVVWLSPEPQHRVVEYALEREPFQSNYQLAFLDITYNR